MRKIASIIFLLTLLFQLKAQDHVFILVDISKSIKANELVSSKQLVKDILQGNPINTTIFTVQGGLPSFNYANGSKLMIMPFGNKSTVMNYIPILNDIKTKNDIVDFIDKYFRTDVTDDWTYLTLAKARLPQIAGINQMKSYILILVSDNTSDVLPGGKSLYSDDEQDLVNKISAIASVAKGTVLIYNVRKAFTITIQKIDLGTYDSDSDGVPDINDKCPNTPKGIPVDAFGCPSTIPPLRIEITSLKGGTSLKPIIVKEKQVTISWFCKNAPVDVQYKIRMSPIDNQNQKTQTFTSAGNSYNIPNVSDGKWRITISPGSNDFVAASANTIIDVKTGGSLWFLWLLFIVGIGSGGYWYWKKLQNDKLKKLNAIPDNDSFSNGSTINTKSENSGYF